MACLGVEQALVHIHVDDLSAALDLLAGYVEGGEVVAGLDQAGEFARAGHVSAFAYIDEVGLLADLQRFQSAQAGIGDVCGQGAGPQVQRRSAPWPGCARG